MRSPVPLPTSAVPRHRPLSAPGRPIDSPPPPPPLPRRRRSTSATTLSSALTEEKLRDLRRSEEPSPYYRGLLAFPDLDLAAAAPLSPSRESHVTTAPSVASSARSISESVFEKVRDWGSSCFTRRRSQRDEGGGAEGGCDADDGAAAASLKATSSFPVFQSAPVTGRCDLGRGLVVEVGEGRPLKENEPASVEAEAARRKTEEKEAARRKDKALRRCERRAAREREAAEEEEDAIAKKRWSDSVQMRGKGKPLREIASAVTLPSASSALSGGEVEAGEMAETRSYGREFVWADKYRPKLLNDFICNRAKAEDLHQQVVGGKFGHFIFEGSPGVGKTTMVLAMLREVFGVEKVKTTNQVMAFQLKGEVVPDIKVNVKVSHHHFELNLSELHGNENHVIVPLFTDSSSNAKKATNCGQTNCKAIVIHEADRLSTDAQYYIRWLMEKYHGCNKIIFCCSNANKLQPIKNLCKVVTLLPPSESEIIQVLEFIAVQEGIQLPHNLAKRMAESSKQNLRQAIRAFEASWQSSYHFKEDQEILTGWEEDIAYIAKSIILDQSPRQLYLTRGKLKNLIEHNVSPQYIISNLIAELKKHSDKKLHLGVDALYQEFINLENMELFDYGNSENQLDRRSIHDPKRNVHQFMRIEEFTAKFMSFYKSFNAKTLESRVPS